MSDLVKRLREPKGWIGGKAPDEFSKAADRIEALEAKNARLRAALTMIEHGSMTYLNDAGNLRRAKDIARAALKGDT